MHTLCIKLENITVIYIHLNLLMFRHRISYCPAYHKCHVITHRDISYDELSCAAKQPNNDKAPGLNGLPAEFYKSFSDQIGRDFYSVLMYSLRIGLLPLSCRRAVITLIPKRGDNDYLKKWRPISLLCSDTLYYE